MLKRKNITQEQTDLWGGIDPAEQTNSTRGRGREKETGRSDERSGSFQRLGSFVSTSLEEPALTAAECPSSSLVSPGFFYSSLI